MFSFYHPLVRRWVKGNWASKYSPVHTKDDFLSICLSVLPRSQLVTAHNNSETVPKFGSFLQRETLLAPSLAWWDLEKCKSAIELVLSATFFQSLLQLLLLRFSTARETSTATAIELVLSATFFSLCCSCCCSDSQQQERLQQQQRPQPT